MRSSTLVELEFGVLVFVEKGEPENPEKNPRSKVKTNNKLKPPPGRHLAWWEANVLPTTQSLLTKLVM